MRKGGLRVALSFWGVLFQRCRLCERSEAIQGDTALPQGPLPRVTSLRS